jgi:hypothetical protein
MPAIISGLFHVDFKNFDRGYRDLTRALNLKIKKEIKQALKDVSEKADANKEEYSSSKITIFRSAPKELSRDEVVEMLSKFNFFDSSKNETGSGFSNKYESTKIKNAKVVIDHAAGLIWQQGGSNKALTYENAKKYVKKLNQKKIAGFDDWRLRTLEEGMSLMEPKRNNAGLHIDSNFDKTQRWIWTSDKVAGKLHAWVVGFVYGSCDRGDYCSFLLGNNYVRAVRSAKSS